MAERIRWKRHRVKVGKRKGLVWWSGQFPGGYDDMHITHEPKRARPWIVEYLNVRGDHRYTTRSFRYWEDAEAFAKTQARFYVLDFLQGARDALEALA